MTASRQWLKDLKPADWFMLVFGLFLGLSIIKFGNPIVLDSHVEAPASLNEFWSFPWPPRWSVWILFPLVFIGMAIAITLPGMRWPGRMWLWLIPAFWIGWQMLSAITSVDRSLTFGTILQFTGCVACYIVSACLIRGERMLRLLFAGLMIGFVFCLMRAVDQRLFEFPQERQFLIESERGAWTNMPPAMFEVLKQQSVIISTNGIDIVNPVYLAKYTRGRVHGTLVYPNALAGAVLLLFPAGIALAIDRTRRFRVVTRALTIGLTLFLGLGSLYWTGSKSGWLIGLGMCGLWLFRLKWAARLKIGVVFIVFSVGLTLFAVKFQGYFAAGATSVGARFDYWRAALQITADRPLFGTGPGTFQHPYAARKRPESEMARLVHNDYLEQFCDSGLVGGLAYLSWIALLTLRLSKQLWTSESRLFAATSLGVLGWFLQGLSEFSLYVPGLAWTAFTLAGGLLWINGGKVGNGNGIDKSQSPR